jgi:hypothetical protein
MARPGVNSESYPLWLKCTACLYKCEASSRMSERDSAVRFAKQEQRTMSLVVLLCRVSDAGL